MRKLIITHLLLIVSLGLFAFDDALWKTIITDPTRAGVCMHGYEFNLPSQLHDTPAPKGYTPFYISHYGRHGSRSNWGDKDYRMVIDLLKEQQQKENLTPAGESLLTYAQAILKAYDGMDGRLTDKGEREHALLAQRMYRRFTPVFQRDLTISAISSTIQRSIISMCAFTNALTALQPATTFNFDCGETLQKYIACAGEVDDKDMHECITKMMEQFPANPKETSKKLFKEPIELSERQEKAIYYTFNVAEDFDIAMNPFDYLSDESLYRQMMRLTYDLSIPFIRIPGFYERRQPTVQLLIKDIIAKADMAIKQNETEADLRFGHDVHLLALSAALNVSGVGEKLAPEDIEHRWYGWTNVPMASNIQFIFYRKKNDPAILFKVLYNETERQLLDLKPVDGPNGVYYNWEDFKKHFAK